MLGHIKFQKLRMYWKTKQNAMIRMFEKGTEVPNGQSWNNLDKKNHIELKSKV